MSSSGFPPENPPRSRQSPADAPSALPDSPPATIPLREQIKRGWDWAVFVGQMLRRVGGPIDLLLAFWTMISILATRLLTQLGLRRP